MYNWSVDEKKFEKQNPKAYALWRITQMLNYGLNGKKLNRQMVKRAWPSIKDSLDPNTAVYLSYLLWNKRPYSQSFIKNFWSLS